APRCGSPSASAPATPRRWPPRWRRASSARWEGRSVGERLAVQRSFAAPPAGARAAATKAREPAVSPLQVLRTTRALQTQLAVGAADDPFEREAERTADAVVGTGWSARRLGEGPLAASLLRVVQRALGKGEPATTKNDDEERRKRVQKGSTGGGPEGGPRGVESSIAAMAAGGAPLASSVRAFFERRFGFDFARVRTHTGNGAAAAALALGARAFTVGDHIFFGAGEYRPESADGRRLVAHEL